MINYPAVLARQREPRPHAVTASFDGSPNPTGFYPGVSLITPEHAIAWMRAEYAAMTGVDPAKVRMLSIEGLHRRLAKRYTPENLRRFDDAHRILMHAGIMYPEW